MAEMDDPLATGMRRQLEKFHEALRAGMPRVGWKIGVNDARARERLGLPSMVVGWLDGRRILIDGDAYRTPAGSRPRLEAEVAVRLARDLAGGVTAGAAADAIAGVAPAFEFVDAAKPLVPIDEMLANDILHEATLFGEEHPVRVVDLDTRGLPQVTVNGVLRAEGIGGRVPDDPGEIVAFVAAYLARYGEQLQAGDRIICGTYIDPFDLVAGDEIAGDFGSLGTIRTRIAG
jgi:2-keto-4-pentenoate hydratase